MSRRSTERASFYSHMGEENNNITHEILILVIWFIEQKVIIFPCRNNIRDEPAPPGPAMTLFDALYIRSYGSYGLGTTTQCLHTVKNG